MSPRGKICRKNFKRHESIVSNEGKFLDLVGSRLTKTTPLSVKIVKIKATTKE